MNKARLEKARCITWWGSLHDGVYHYFGWFVIEDVREFTSCLEFLLVFTGYIVEKNRQVLLLLLVVVVIWNRDAPEGDLMCGNIIEPGCLLGLDCALEIMHCLRLVDFNREGLRCCLSINKTEKGQMGIGHGVAKHRTKKTDGRNLDDVMNMKNERWGMMTKDGREKERTGGKGNEERAQEQWQRRRSCECGKGKRKRVGVVAKKRAWEGNGGNRNETYFLYNKEIKVTACVGTEILACLFGAFAL